MGFFDPITDAVDSIGDAFSDELGATLGGIAGGVGGFFVGGPAGAAAGASLGANFGGSIERGFEADKGADRLKTAQNRILENKTLRQLRQQTRSARASRAGVQNARAVGGLGQDSSVSATAVSSNRAQLSFNLAQLRNSLENQRAVADAKEDIQEAQSPGFLEQAIQIGGQAFGLSQGFGPGAGSGAGIVTNSSGNAPTTGNFLDDFTAPSGRGGSGGSGLI